MRRTNSRHFGFTPPLNANPSEQNALPSNVARRLLIIQNNGVSSGNARFGTQTSGTRADFVIAPGDTLAFDTAVPRGSLYLWSATGLVTFSVLEESDG